MGLKVKSLKPVISKKRERLRNPEALSAPFWMAVLPRVRKPCHAARDEPRPCSELSAFFSFAQGFECI